MSYIQIIKNWILTILLGSILLPISSMFFGNKTMSFEFEILPFIVIYSLFISIPALIVMLLSNYEIEQTKMNMHPKIIVLWILNTLAIVATFMVLIQSVDFWNRAIPLALPYIIVNSIYYAYHNSKPYHKPEILNFPN